MATEPLKTNASTPGQDSPDVFMDAGTVDGQDAIPTVYPEVIASLRSPSYLIELEPC